MTACLPPEGLQALYLLDLRQNSEFMDLRQIPGLRQENTVLLKCLVLLVDYVSFAHCFVSFDSLITVLTARVRAGILAVFLNFLIIY